MLDILRRRNTELCAVIRYQPISTTTSSVRKPITHAASLITFSALTDCRPLVIRDKPQSRIPNGNNTLLQSSGAAEPTLRFALLNLFRCPSLAIELAARPFR